MTGCVTEECAFEAAILARFCVERLNRDDVLSIGFNFEGMIIQEEIDIFFSTDNRFLLCIFELFKCSGGFLRMIGEFFNDLADARIFSSTDIPHCPDTNLAGTVPSENRTILNQCYFATSTSS